MPRRPHRPGDLSPALTGRGEDLRVSYAVDDGPPIDARAGTPPSGTGVAIKGDVVRLLTIAARRAAKSPFASLRPQGAALDGRYALAA